MVNEAATIGMNTKVHGLSDKVISRKIKNREMAKENFLYICPELRTSINWIVIEVLIPVVICHDDQCSALSQKVFDSGLDWFSLDEGGKTFLTGFQLPQTSDRISN